MRQNSLPLKNWLVKGLTVALVLTLCGTGVIFFHSSATAKVIFRWSKINYWAFLLACLALLGSWLMEGIRIFLIAEGLGAKISFRKIIGINLASTFTGNITPFYAGGVPTQIYLLCQNGIQPGKASAVVTIRIILSTLVFTLFAPFLLMFYQAQLSTGIIRQATIIAIPISFIVSIALICFIIKPKLAKILFSLLFKSMQSIKFLNKMLPTIEKFLNELDVFHYSIKNFRQGNNFYWAIICSFLYWALFFSIAPFTMFALGINIADMFWKIIIFQFILVFIISYLPIPGGSGLMELGFYSVLVFIPANLRAVFVLIWRFLSYYLSTLVGGIILVRIINRPFRQPVGIPN